MLNSINNLDNWYFIEYEGRWYIKYVPWYWPFGCYFKHYNDSFSPFGSIRSAANFTNLYGFRSKERAARYLKEYLNRDDESPDPVRASEIMNNKEIEESSKSENMLEI